MPQLAPGSVVTTPRTCVQYVVTEYGVADLKYKSTVERARALIAIAHPDFRRELSGKCPSESPASCGCLDDLDKVPLFPGGALYCFAEFCGGGRKRSRKDLTFPGRLRRIKKLKRIRALV